jgi:hypothetical protein
MKKQRPGLFVMVLVFASLACNSLVPNSANKVDNAPEVDFITSAEPLNVTVQLDELYTVSGPISVNGGSMVLTGADGTVFTLDVPAKALDTDTVITMTAVRSITGAPLGSDAVFAVQLEPSGLFFNEFVTLTVTPAQAIPIENQIIFAYEGNGQDYHLAIIDPKSRAIKIKLLEFSGAGVGSGGDKEWAANLQHQANDSRVRLQNEVAKLLQPERLAQLLGEEPNDQISSTLKSYMEKYYDQVVQKEMVAAELDCKYAEKAIQDLIGLERTNQLLGLNGVDANGETIPIVDDWPGKIAKLEEIGKKCQKAAYRIVGGLDDWQTDTAVCDIMKPFALTSSILTLHYTGGLSGTFSYSGGPFGAAGGGSYTISLPDGIGKPGTMTDATEGVAGGASGSGTAFYMLTPIDPAAGCTQ